MKGIYISFIIFLSFLALAIFFVGARYKAQSKINQFDPLRIAHAGGGVSNVTYTNSYEALNTNVQLGFRYFELDFSFTKDNQLICLHDWQHSFERTFGYTAKRKLTLEEFEQNVESHSQFTKCTLKGLVTWLAENPSAHIVTDIREDNIRALELIYNTVPDAQNRVIPQMYLPEEFDAIRNIGFKQIVWTLYRFQGSEAEVLDWSRRFDGSLAVAMSIYKATASLLLNLKEMQIPTYVHTINDHEELEKYRKLGITEIYTDFLIP